MFGAFQKGVTGFDAEVRDESDAWVLLAIQGPKSVEILGAITPAPLSDLKYYAISEAKIANVDCLLAISGYTAENAYEIYIPVAASEIAVGRAKYSLICNEAGGIIDDLNV